MKTGSPEEETEGKQQVGGASKDIIKRGKKVSYYYVEAEAIWAFCRKVRFRE